MPRWVGRGWGNWKVWRTLDSMRKIHTKQGGATPTSAPPSPLACCQCSFWGNNRNASSTLAHKGAMGDGRWASAVGSGWKCPRTWPKSTKSCSHVKLIYLWELTVCAALPVAENARDGQLTMGLINWPYFTNRWVVIVEMYSSGAG